ncbi:hypothetical protein SAMN02746098_00367 [Desulfosporosinus lacus DSM 15449]|uniref:Uncharacterized protein n=1 Tax=Desulfosporosinus lacus DSM 15449 TaxID=1121420 RepID=A0A1M5QU60_9FIRM|nr:hypothetical protein SAMN02746098_00367 [Desulfosporosinus lacus DSM 15449]
MLYGILGTLGATKVNLVTPQTVLAEFIEHTIYRAKALKFIIPYPEVGLSALFFLKKVWLSSKRAFKKIITPQSLAMSMFSYGADDEIRTRDPRLGNSMSLVLSSPRY